MLMSRVLVILTALAVALGALTGRMEEVSRATLSGASDAVQLLLQIGGSLCLWSGLMEVVQRSGLAEKAAKLLSPLISRLFGHYAKDRPARAAIAQNLTANLLGLGSAATPSGLKAAKRLRQLSDERGTAPHGVFLLMILNTASIQLLPTTVAALRAGLGSQTPFDILPAVWLTSICSVCAGVLAAGLFRGGKL